MKRIAIGGLLALAASASFAETLVWWRFDQVEPGKAFEGARIVNVADPQSGAYDGWCYRVNKKDWKKAYKESLGTATFPDGVLLYDPVSSQSYTNNCGMVLCGSSDVGSVYLSGAVVAKDPSVFRRQSFTAEAFVRLPQTMEANTTAGSPNAIFGVERALTDDAWGFHYNKGYILSRFNIGGVHSPGSVAKINDDKWHHIAFVAEAEGDTAVRVKLYLDYKLFHDQSYEGQVDYEGASDFVIGVNRFADGRKFPGCIDEFRFSDKALAPSEFLRFKDENLGLGEMFSSDFAAWWSMEAYPADYWFALDPGCGRVYWQGETGWMLTKYHFGGDAGEKVGAYVGDHLQDTVWDRSYGAGVANGGSYRTINLETVTADQQKQGDYVMLTPPAGDSPLTDDDFTLEYFYKSNGGNKLGTNCTLMMLPTDDTGDFKNPSPVLQHYFSKAGTASLIYLSSTNGQNECWAIGTLDSKWHHFACVYEKTAQRLTVYVDRKVERTVEDLDLKVTSQSIVLGARGRMWNSNAAFDGWIDEVRITRRALAKNELMQLKPRPSGLLLIAR